MARVTIEDCLGHVENMYELVHVATKRVRQLYRGSEPLVNCKNRIVVTALREIATGKIKVTMQKPTTSDDDFAPLPN